MGAGWKEDLGVEVSDGESPSPPFIFPGILAKKGITHML